MSKWNTQRTYKIFDFNKNEDKISKFVGKTKAMLGGKHSIKMTLKITYNA